MVALLALVPRRCAPAAPPACRAALAEASALTAAATLGTAPLIALHFERLSLVSLPANVLAAPAVAPVMWLGTIAGALGQFAPGAARRCALAALPLALPGLAGRRRRGAAEAELAGPRRARRRGGAYLAAAGCRARLARALPAARAAGRGRRSRSAAGRRARRRRARPPRGPPGAAARPDVSFLDVGQGDATLIQHGAPRVLVDTGPPGGPCSRGCATPACGGWTCSS